MPDYGSGSYPANHPVYGGNTSKVETLRRLALAARFNNARTKGVMAAPPTVTADGASAPAGQTKAYRWTTTPEAFRLLGGRPVVYSTTYTRIANATLGTTGGNVTTTEHNTAGYVEFMADAAKVTVRVAGSTTAFRFKVDDQFVDMTGIVTTSNSGAQYITLDFGSRAVRKIAVELQQANAFDGVYVGVTESIYKTPSEHLLRGIVVGDSYTNGAGADHSSNAFSLQLGEYLGIRDLWPSSVGGSGYIVKNANNYNFAERLDVDVLTRSPDLVVFAGGFNDRAAQSAAAITAAALSLFQRTRNALPNALIFALGPWAGASGPDANCTVAENAIKAAVTAMNDRLTMFVPQITDAGGSWLFGTGRVGATNSSGNSDLYIGSDGTHPSDAGHGYLAKRTADGILTQLATL